MEMFANYKPVEHLAFLPLSLAQVTNITPGPVFGGQVISPTTPCGRFPSRYRPANVEFYVDSTALYGAN